MSVELPKPVEIPSPNMLVPLPVPNTGLLWPKGLLGVPVLLPNPVDEPPNPPKLPDVKVVPPKRLPPPVVAVEPKLVTFWLKGGALEPNPLEPNALGVPPKGLLPVLVAPNPPI